MNNFVIWITGLSGSGKTTIAEQTKIYLESIIPRSLICKDIIILDGDEIRQGINKDLKYSKSDRIENIRRISEMAKFLRDRDFTVIVACMSPYKINRDLAKQIIGEDYFLEVFCNTSLDICQKRDVKGLYAKSMAGNITNFVIDFEKSLPWDILWLSTGNRSIASCVEILISKIREKFI